MHTNRLYKYLRMVQCLAAVAESKRVWWFLQDVQSLFTGRHIPWRLVDRMSKWCERCVGSSGLKSLLCMFACFSFGLVTE